MSVRHTLKSACTQIVDCEHKTAPIDETGEYYAVGTPAMRGNTINYEESRRINEATFRAWTRRLTPRPGDLLFAREAPVGPIVKIPKALNVAPGQRTVLLRPNPDIVDPEYLFYLLSSPLQQSLIAAKAAGSTVAHLNVADIRAFELPDLPTTSEQRRIASILGSLDKKIATNALVVSTSDALVRAYFTELGRTATRTKSIGDIASARREVVDPRLCPPGTPYVGLEHMPRRRLWMDQMGDAQEVTSGKSRFHSGDVLFGKLRPYFHKVASVETEGVCSTDVLVLKSVDPELRGFVLAAASSDQVVSACTASSEGTRMPRTNWQDLAAALVPWPGREDARAFARKVEALSVRAHGAIAESAALAAVREAILPALMSGHIRVNSAWRDEEGSVA